MWDAFIVFSLDVEVERCIDGELAVETGVVTTSAALGDVMHSKIVYVYSGES